MLRNSIRGFFPEGIPEYNIFEKRPEQLSVNEFVELTNLIENQNFFENYRYEYR